MKTNTKHSARAAFVLATGIALTACSSGSTSKPAANTDTSKAKSSGGGAAIVIKTFQFTPSPATVSSGTVNVRNDDNTTHTFTSDEKGLFTLTLKGPNASGTVTIPKGTHKFHCEIHPSMTGQITVK